MDQQQWLKQAEVAGIALTVLVISLVVRRWFLHRMEMVAGKNPRSMAAALAEDLPMPSLLWCLAAAIAVAVNYATLTPATVHTANRLIVSALILSFTLATGSALVRLIERFGEQHTLPFAVAGVSRTLARAFVYSIGLMLLLRFLGINTTPFFTALGFGSLALALSLQDTLGNFFAGLHILMERPIAVGDLIRLNDKEEGTVTDIGWRTTRIVTGLGSTLVMPNKSITTGHVLNYSSPDARVKVSIPIVLHLEADAERAGLIAVECALGVDGVTKDPPPSFVADPGMLPTHLQYKLTVQIPAQNRAGGIRTQIVNRMLERFRREEIPLPDPRLVVRE
jgi:MscS family membrane protein